MSGETDWDLVYRNEVDALAQVGLARSLRTVDGGSGPTISLDGREVLALCSNDYLGMSRHPRVVDAAREAAGEWGAGSGSSRLVAGSLALHEELEVALADFKRVESCLLFGSGYLANLGVLPALAEPGGVVVSDSLNHASLIDGCRLARAEIAVYPHGDVEAIEAILRSRRGRSAIVVTDSVFSMDGDLAPLADIVAVSRRFGARVVVDEAHGTGVVGSDGRGLVPLLGLESEVDVVVGTLSKALGSYGAFVCCSRALREFLVNRARSLIFSTALPPPSVAAALSAVRMIEADPEPVRRMQANAAVLRAGLAGQGLDVVEGTMPIVPVVLGPPDRAMAACAASLQGGVFAQAIRPPTVPEGTSRLRLVATAAHSPAQMERAATVVAASIRSGAPS